MRKDIVTGDFATALREPDVMVMVAFRGGVGVDGDTVNAGRGCEVLPNIREVRRVIEVTLVYLYGVQPVEDGELLGDGLRGVGCRAGLFKLEWGFGTEDRGFRRGG